MSILLSLIRLSDVTSQTLLKDPGQMGAFVYGEDFGFERPKPGFWGRLFGRKAKNDPPAAACRPLPVREEEDEIDLDKAWHGLHFLLTKRAEGGEFPQAFLRHGGTLLEGVEGLDFPLHLFDAAQVRQIDALLQGLTEEHVRAAYDGERMEQLAIYPPIWVRDGEQAFEYLRDYFTRLRDFVHTTATRGQGLLLYFS